MEHVIFTKLGRYDCTCIGIRCAADCFFWETKYGSLPSCSRSLHIDYVTSLVWYAYSLKNEVESLIRIIGNYIVIRYGFCRSWNQGYKKSGKTSWAYFFAKAMYPEYVKKNILFSTYHLSSDTQEFNNETLWNLMKMENHGKTAVKKYQNQDMPRYFVSWSIRWEEGDYNLHYSRFHKS